MKRFKLELHQIEGAELLSKEQLKSIFGGQKVRFDGCADGCPDGQFPCECDSGSVCAIGCVSSVEECWNMC